MSTDLHPLDRPAAALPTGVPVYIENGVVMHARPDCPQIDGPVESGRYPERTGFVCSCVEDASGVDFTNPYGNLHQPVATTQADSLDAPERGDGPGRSHEPIETLTDADVIEIINRLGRKFDPADVTPALARWAADWLRSYEGDFDFLLDVRSKMKSSLSTGQAKGVLNCARAGLARGEWGTTGADAPAAPANGPSEKQEAFVAGLLAERGYDAEAIKSAYADNGVWTRQTVSKLIDALLNDEVPEHGPAAAAPAAVEVEPGTYIDDATGEWVEIVRGKSGNLYGKVYADGDWQYEGKASLRRPLRKATADEAARFGHDTGHCVFCHREITTDESLAVGYGPICADKYGLPWGA